ncbi:hypothetical protein CM49_06647 [Paenibacillus sp. P1XP2]|nr:hypothetical protein CM49_06647 [Paenibacillus sp. P1XP2]
MNKLKTFSILVLVLIFVSFGATKALASSFFPSWHYKQNIDNTLFIEGVDEESKGSSISVEVMTYDKEREYLFQGTAKVNQKGYFSITTTSIDPQEVKGGEITINLKNQSGQQLARTESFPIITPDLSDYYYIPQDYDEHFYDPYKDGYIEPKEPNYEEYGVGKLAKGLQTPKLMSQIPKPISVAASNDHVVVLTQDGSVYGWGNNTHNEINSSNDLVLSPVKIGTFGNLKKVEAGSKFSLYLTKDGDLYGWGDLKFLGVKVQTGLPTKLNLVQEPVTDINVYDRAVAVLTQSGNVYQLGGTAWGGSDALDYMHNYHRKIDISGATSIAMGDNKGYAVKSDGSLWSWSNAIIEGTTSATKMPDFKDIRKLSAASTNGDYVVAIDKYGQLWGLGNNIGRQFGFTVSNMLYKPTNLTMAPLRFTGTQWVPTKQKLLYQTISSGRNGSLLLTSNNELLILGSYYLKDADKGFYKDVTYVETSDSNMYWISNGKLLVYGDSNQFGQLGVGVKQR